jgi:hypothetical protein
MIENHPTDWGFVLIRLPDSWIGFMNMAYPKIGRACSDILFEKQKSSEYAPNP